MRRAAVPVAVFFTFLFALVVWTACVGDDPGASSSTSSSGGAAVIGEHGGKCFDDGKCKEGLVCADGIICLNKGETTGDSSGGGTSSGTSSGTSASGGTSSGTSSGTSGSVDGGGDATSPEDAGGCPVLAAAPNGVGLDCVQSDGGVKRCAADNYCCMVETGCVAKVGSCPSQRNPYQCLASSNCTNAGMKACCLTGTIANASTVCNTKSLLQPPQTSSASSSGSTSGTSGNAVFEGSQCSSFCDVASQVELCDPQASPSNCTSPKVCKMVRLSLAASGGSPKPYVVHACTN